MEIILSTIRNLLYVVANHPIYSFVAFLILLIVLVRCYIRMSVGMCDSDQDMTGKTVLITGATAGIGRATAEDLARRNARVILACRNLEKSNRVAQKIISSTGNKNVVVKHLDLASFKTVRKCAEDVLKTEEKLHVLMNNAGIFSEGKTETEDGCEYVLQSNHFGHFLLTMLLLDLVKKSAPSRIINVSSSSHAYGKIDVNDFSRKNYGALELYGRSKLANVLFTRELASRLADTGVTVNAVHPGLVYTEVMSKVPSFISVIATINMQLFGKTSEEGAQTSIYLAVHPDVEKTTGKYFADCREEKVDPKALDKTLAKQFFEASEKIVGLSPSKA